MKKHHPFLFLLVSLLALAGLAACSFSLAGDVTPPPGYSNTPVLETPVPASGGSVSASDALPASYDLSNGRSIYVEKCAPCHGSTGAGNGSQAAQLPNPPVALGDAEIGSDALPRRWYEIVSNGNLEKFMPPFASLTPQERWDVVFYSLSLSAPPELVESGGQIYQNECLACHGGQGKDAGADFSVPAYWIDTTLQDVQAAIAAGNPPEMPAYENALQPEEITAVAAYLRTLSSSPVAATGPGEAPEVSEARSGKIMVSGRVVHASGKELPSDLKVILQVYENMQPIVTLETVAEKGGAYTFSDIDQVAGQFVVVSAVYQNMQFFSDVVPAADLPQNGTTDLPVTVYDTSTDTSTLIVERAHVFLNFETPGKIQVVEMLNVRNPHATVVTSEKEGEAVLRFKLPQDADNLQFQDGVLGGRYIRTEDGFGDTGSIPPAPNPYQILFAYEIPYEKNRTTLQISIPMPVQSLLVAAPVKGVHVKSDGLADTGQRDVQGMQIQLYQANNLSANQAFELAISGWPSSGAGILPGSTGTLLFGAGAFVLVVAAAGIFLFRQQRARQSAAGEEILPEEETADTLLDAILALEDRYQAGELPEEVFHQRRSELKTRLFEVYKNQGEQPPNGND